MRIYNKMSSKFETVDNESERISLIKYEGPVDITQKLEAYEKAKLMERANESRPSSEGTNFTKQTYSIQSYHRANGKILEISISCNTSRTNAPNEKMYKMYRKPSSRH